MKFNKYILGFLTLFAVFFGYKYYNNNANNNKTTNPLLAISNRTSSFLYLNNIAKFNSKIDSLSYRKIIIDNLLFKKIIQEIKFLDTVLLLNDDFKYKKVVFAPYNIGSSKVEYLCIIELEKNISLAKIKQSFTNKISNYKFQDFKIYNFKIYNQEITFSLYNNLLLISKQTILVEEALSTLTKKSQKTNSKDFKKLRIEKLDEDDLHLFIDFNATKDLDAILINAEINENISVKDINWSYSAISFTENSIDFKTNYSFKESYRQMDENFAVPFSLDSFLSNNTAYFEAYTSRNNRHFISKDISYKYFKDWLDEEIAFFTLETYEEDYLKRSALVLKAKNADTAKLNLYLLNKEMSPVDEQSGLAIYQMNVNAVSKIFKSHLINFDNPYFVFIDNYVVFSDSKNVLTSCYDKYKSNNVLAKDKQFKLFLKSNDFNKITYLNPQRFLPVLESIFTSNSNFSNFGRIKNETFISDSIIFSLGKISFKKEEIRHSTKIWEVSLDTVSNFRTQIVINADNQRKEIFTQDLKNQVYLINKSGEIIFKKKIKERIIGNVFQIDYFKSGKLQYVFNTKNFIYVMERTGKLVDEFPLKLPTEASNSIFVVNYDKTKKYRYFVACKNGKVYGYEANGKPLKSWSPLGVFGNISNALKHTSFSDKDFIYFNTDGGTFYAFNRKGEKRFESVNIGGKINQAFERYKYGFINLSKGTLYKIDIKGKTTAKVLADSTFNIFTNYEEKQAFAIANKNEIRILQSRWKILGKKKLNDEILSIEKTKIQGEIWFLVNCKKSIYLINDRGEIHPDFPKFSSSKARISKFYDNKNELMIFVDEHKLKTYQLVLPD